MYHNDLITNSLYSNMKALLLLIPIQSSLQQCLQAALLHSSIWIPSKSDLYSRILQYFALTKPQLSLAVTSSCMLELPSS